MSLAWKPTGPVSPHHFRNDGCHCSSARCRRLSPEMLTLFGIDSSSCDIAFSLSAAPVELGALRLAIERQRAALAGRVGTDEDPVLPGREAPEDLRIGALRAGEAELRLHSGQGVGRERESLLHGHPELLVE